MVFDCKSAVFTGEFCAFDCIRETTPLRVFQNRLKFAGPSADTPAKTETALLKLYPREYWGPINHQWVLFGRETCVARSPKCGECFVCDLCPSCGKV